MKNGKNPNRRQQIAITEANLNPDNWLVFKVEPAAMHIVHRISGKTQIIQS
ncbi:hypothetical protein MHB46_02285 [Paenibacillus sp. FSL H7-0703]|uniref:DUF6906 family protein n=1 Tax=Paenibacillus sp. FSL H7-0703 TaxID=2921438 RepID=UPI0030FCF9E1